MHEEPRVCVIVPTYNERGNIRKLVEAVKDCHIPNLTLLFVDDSSPDGTGEEISAVADSEPWVRLLSRSSKKGIGGAYLAGFRNALQTLSPDILIEMDADFQHPPKTISDLIDAVGRGADVVIASRYVSGGGIGSWGRTRRLVSRTANAYSRLVLGLPVKDATSGFRAYSRRAVERLTSANLPTRGFEFQVAALYVLKGEMRMDEVPFVFQARTVGASKLGLIDILRFIFAIISLPFVRETVEP